MTSRSSRKAFSGGIPISRQLPARLRMCSAVFSSKIRPSMARLFKSQNATSEASATRRLPPRKGRVCRSAKTSAATLSEKAG
jgi:hypothetical protein